MKKLATVFVALTLFAAVTSVHAKTYTGNKTVTVKKEGTVTLKASATFVVSNLELVVTLTNTGQADPRSPADILTGIFFNVVPDQQLTPVSASVGTNSTVIGHRLPLGFDGDVGAEWAYKDDLTYVGANGSDDEGISSTKLQWFKKADLFPGMKIPGVGALSGAQFGITTLNDMVSNDLGSLKNKGLIQSTVVFTFDVPADFSADDISNVNFQYGTSIKKGLDIAGEVVAQIPEPSTVMLVALGLVGALSFARSTRRHQ